MAITPCEAEQPPAQPSAGGRGEQWLGVGGLGGATRGVVLASLAQAMRTPPSDGKRDLVTALLVRVFEVNVVPGDGEVRLMGGERQHHQIGVQPVQAVPRVGVVAGLQSGEGLHR